jgi:hypothetical protein
VFPLIGTEPRLPELDKEIVLEMKHQNIPYLGIVPMDSKEILKPNESIYRLNEKDEVWEFFKILTETDFKDKDTIKFHTKHLGIYCIGQTSSERAETGFFIYPNPAKKGVNAIKFGFFVPSKRIVTIDIYDLAYNKVQTLHKEVKSEEYSNIIEWDITDIAPGVYICVFKGGSKAIVKKVLIVR